MANIIRTYLAHLTRHSTFLDTFRMLAAKTTLFLAWWTTLSARILATERVRRSASEHGHCFRSNLYNQPMSANANAAAAFLAQLVEPSLRTRTARTLARIPTFEDHVARRVAEREHFSELLFAG